MPWAQSNFSRLSKKNIEIIALIVKQVIEMASKGSVHHQSGYRSHTPNSIRCQVKIVLSVGMSQLFGRANIKGSR